MKSISTKYGTLNDISRVSSYENEQPESLCLDGENKLDTSFGILIPRFIDDSGRRKNKPSLSFYRSGNLKSIDLQKQSPIKTPIGLIDAELITFYENGAIKRIFPLNGAITGIWTEEDEATLVKPLSIHLLDTDFKLNINSIYFYPNGSVKSVSLYPGKTTLLPTPIGTINTRIGFSLSESGQLISLEPAAPSEIKTSLGILHAYDSSAIGLHADNNSLTFTPNGQISGLTTSTDIIKLKDHSDTVHPIAPTFIRSQVNPEESELVPLKIKILPDFVTFFSQKEFTIKTSDIDEIKISSIPLFTNQCSDCASCGKCGNH